jgi:hypothetical protein
VINESIVIPHIDLKSSLGDIHIRWGGDPYVIELFPVDFHVAIIDGEYYDMQ